MVFSEFIPPSMAWALVQPFSRLGLSRPHRRLWRRRRGRWVLGASTLLNVRYIGLILVAPASAADDSAFRAALDLEVTSASSSSCMSRGQRQQGGNALERVDWAVALFEQNTDPVLPLRDVISFCPRKTSTESSKWLGRIAPPLKRLNFNLDFLSRQ